MSTREQKDYRKDGQVNRYSNQVKQIRNQNKYFGQDPKRGIYIQTITARQKGNIGIYGYNSYSTHFGRVNFFQYKDSIVILLDRSNLDSLQITIENFLHENHFNKRQIKATKNKVKKLWDIYSTNIF